MGNHEKYTKEIEIFEKEKVSVLEIFFGCDNDTKVAKLYQLVSVPDTKTW